MTTHRPALHIDALLAPLGAPLSHHNDPAQSPSVYPLYGISATRPTAATPSDDAASPAVPAAAAASDSAGGGNGGGGSDGGGNLGGSSSSNPGAATNTKKAAARQPSCTNCYQRKIRCPKNKPVCTTCVKRGVASTCQYVDRRELPVDSRPPARKPSRTVVASASTATASPLEAPFAAAPASRRTGNPIKGVESEPADGEPDGAFRSMPEDPTLRNFGEMDMNLLADKVADKMAARVADLLSARLLPSLQ